LISRGLVGCQGQMVGDLSIGLCVVVYSSETVASVGVESVEDRWGGSERVQEMVQWAIFEVTRGYLIRPHP